MCSVFGLIDYQNKLTTREKNRFITPSPANARYAARMRPASPITSADGCASSNGHCPHTSYACACRPGASVVMGHTRMTTQGNEKFNQNNHPFAGSIGGKTFALAHNGILWNDKLLRETEHLPQTQRRNRQLCCSAAFGKAKRPRLCQPKNYG